MNCPFKKVVYTTPKTKTRKTVYYPSEEVVPNNLKNKIVGNCEGKISVDTEYDYGGCSCSSTMKLVLRCNYDHDILDSYELETFIDELLSLVSTTPEVKSKKYDFGTYHNIDILDALVKGLQNEV